MIPNLTAAQIDLLGRLLDAYATSGLPLPSLVPTPQPASPAATICLGRTVSKWRSSRRGDGSGSSGVALLDRLTPGTATDDDPLRASGNRFPLTAITSNTVTAADIEDAVAVGSCVYLIEMPVPYDTGEARVTAIATAGSSVTLTLDRTLQSTALGGQLLLLGAWGWDTTERLVTVVNRPDFSSLLVARLGPEYVALTRPRVRGLLKAPLAAATVSGSQLTPGEAILTVYEYDGSNFAKVLDADDEPVEIAIVNLDEYLTVPAHTFVVADLHGDHWEILWASCNASRLPT